MPETTPPAANQFPGDTYSLDSPHFSRAPCGYGVQRLGGDLLLDRSGSRFAPVRQATQNHCFEHFADAAEAGLRWLAAEPQAPLAIVPLAFDPSFERYVLIWGVIPEQDASDLLKPYLEPLSSVFGRLTCT